jgi:hypothetical protein
MSFASSKHIEIDVLMSMPIGRQRGDVVRSPKAMMTSNDEHGVFGLGALQTAPKPSRQTTLPRQMKWQMLWHAIGLIE